MKNKLSRFIKWFAASLQGEDGKLSSKKASIFLCMLLLTAMVVFTACIFYKHPNAGQVFPDIAWLTVGGTGIGFSINQVAQAVKNNKNNE